MPTIALTPIPAGEIKRAPLNTWATDIQAAVNGLDGDNFAAGALAATALLKAAVAGDSESRLIVQADGKLLFGSGALVGDVALSRSAADVLSLATGDHLAVPGGLRLPTKAGIPADSDFPLDEDGNVCVDTTNHAVYVRSGATWRRLAGSDIAYVAFTAPVTVTGTTEGSPTDVVSAGAVTFDGGPCWFEFYAPYVTPYTAVNAAVLGAFYDGSTSQGKTLLAQTPAAQNTSVVAHVRQKLTPAAGSHTFKFAAWRTDGDCAIAAGAGGAGNNIPGYIRITPA